MPTVTNAVDKVVARRSKRQNTNGNGNKKEENQEYKEVKPLIVTKQLVLVSPQVEMEVLKLKPVHPLQRILKARHGMSFNPGSRPGQKRSDLPAQPKVSKNLQKSDSKKTEENTCVNKQNKQNKQKGMMMVQEMQV